MPSEDDVQLCFKNADKQYAAPFAICADFECLTEPVSKAQSKTVAVWSVECGDQHRSQHSKHGQPRRLRALGQAVPGWVRRPSIGRERAGATQLQRRPPTAHLAWPCQRTKRILARYPPVRPGSERRSRHRSRASGKSNPHLLLDAEPPHFSTCAAILLPLVVVCPL